MRSIFGSFCVVLKAELSLFVHDSVSVLASLESITHPSVLEGEEEGGVRGPAQLL